MPHQATRPPYRCQYRFLTPFNSTDALQTVHSGPVSGIAASDHLSSQTGLGNIVATDMGGTSFDIGIVVDDGVKYYDFNPVIDRWLVSIPMVHLKTLGAGGGSIASFDRMFQTVKIGPESAGSDPGPACYDRGGLNATVTDADLLLGYLDRTGLAYTRPEGAYFVMVDISPFGYASDVEFAHWMTREIGVAPVPGSSFFAPGEIRYIRLNFAKKPATLHAAGERLLKLKR